MPVEEMTTDELHAEFGRLGDAGDFGDRLYEIEAELRDRYMVVAKAADVLAR